MLYLEYTLQLKRVKTHTNADHSNITPENEFEIDVKFKVNCVSVFDRF